MIYSLFNLLYSSYDATCIGYTILYMYGIYGANYKETLFD